MHRPGNRDALGVFFVCLLSCLAACGSEAPNADGVAAPASGGATATGGAFGSGGVPAAGGAFGSGGAPGSGGGGVPSSGGESATGGADGAVFQPCPTDAPCKILPLGDSITFGLGFDGGYRVELFRLAQEAGHDITFTGSQAPNGPNTVAGLPFPRNHEGISGQTIQQIADRIPSPGLDEAPHIVLVHAGTNDMWAGASGAPDRLGALVDELLMVAPDALIVVSNIIPWPAQSGAVAAYNAEVQPKIQTRMQETDHLLFVDQFDGFPADELGDGIHPDEAGYARMATKWFAAIEPYLP